MEKYVSDTGSKYRVQEVTEQGSATRFTVVNESWEPVAAIDTFLRSCNPGTDRTYAFLLLDHLRWLEFENISVSSVTFTELLAYMRAAGGTRVGPQSSLWREGKNRYAASTLDTLAACLKQFYIHASVHGSCRYEFPEFSERRASHQRQRRSSLLGHLPSQSTKNPLVGKSIKTGSSVQLPPPDTKERLVDACRTARDRLIVTWLADAGFRVGELCSLRIQDLHLRKDSQCGQCFSPHVHICHREGNPNGARVKVKHSWKMGEGGITGGQLRRVSANMIHTYFDYMNSDYLSDMADGFLVISLNGESRGKPLTTNGVRELFRRLSSAAGTAPVSPHQFRHQFATDLLRESGGDAFIAAKAGGWASTDMVENVYGHLAHNEPVLEAALERIWDTK